MKQQRAMLIGFKKFTDRMAQRYAEVTDCLKAERYEEAHVLLADIAVSHARTSLSLRNHLVKHGKMMEDK